MNELSSQAPRPPRSPKGPFGASDKIAVAVILALATVFGVLAAVFNPILRQAGSREGAEIDRVFSAALGMAAAIFTIVQGALIYIVIRYRRRPGDTGEGWAIHHYLPAEVLWTAIPVMIVTGLSIYSYRALMAIGEPTAPAITVEVRARQFTWEFVYPDQNVTSNVLHVPLGQPVVLKMRSADVIHAFWVPEFRIKRDVMPDRITETMFTGTRLGRFPIVCSRFCGAGHAFMRSLVIVDQQADFQAWLAQQTQAQASTSESIAFGRQLFQRFGCSGCHALSDAGASGQVGPNLNGIGARAGDTKPSDNAEDYVRESVTSPNTFIVPGYPENVMPQDYAQQMTPQELDALIKYLLAQTQ